MQGSCTSPTVCVVIAARNASATVGKAVRSALGEPEVAEVIVVDDASEDGTLEATMQAALGSPKLSTIRLERNRGPAAARNLAVAASTAPLLCVLDADDYFLEGRLRRLLATPNDWDFLADDIILVREDLPLGASNLVTGPGRSRMLSLEDFVRGNLSVSRERRRELGFLKPLIRRSFLKTRELRYDERLRLGEDYALYVEALAGGAIFVVTQACGYVAVERQASLSGCHRTGDLAAIASFDEGILSRSDIADGARAALHTHRDVTLSKWRHRRILDRSRAEGYGAALRELLSCPQSWHHILSETAHAKLALLARSKGPNPPPTPRLLIG